jgi:hypothetical protein
MFELDVSYESIQSPREPSIASSYARMPYSNVANVVIIFLLSAITD